MRHAVALIVIAVALTVLGWSLIASALTTGREQPARPSPAYRPLHARRRRYPQ